MKIQNLNWITFDERKIHHLPAGDCMYDLKVGSCLESQGCGESKYLFNAEPFPLPELQEMRALKGSALPQKKKKKFHQVTLRTQFLLDVIYCSCFLSFTLGNALIQKSLTLE